MNMLNQATTKTKAGAVEPVGSPAWKLQRMEKGPQISASFKFATYASMLLALETLTALQETADHHADFVLEGYHSLSITLCTHEPKWGLSEKDFVMAQVLTEKLQSI